MTKPGTAAPNTEVDEAVENVPKGDRVPNTLGDVASVEKAEVVFGRVDAANGPNTEAVGCELKLDDGRCVTSGLKDAGPGEIPARCSFSSSASIGSSMYSSTLSSWSSAMPSTPETPSMMSEILNTPRIVSMSSIASLPNNRSKMQATKNIITTLPCSRRTLANLLKICIPSASTASSEFLLMGALFRCTWSRKSVVSWKTG